MSTNTSIEWTDVTWNPVRGCSVISPGCINCYAMKQAHRFSGAGKPYEGLTKQTSAGPQWTGVIRTIEKALTDPLHWRAPKRVFVNSMSDLFHEYVPDEFIERVFAVMALCPHHTFQVLTKRADRMRRWLQINSTGGRIFHIAQQIDPHHIGARSGAWPLPNVWLGVSCESQKHADERIPHLLTTPAAVRFVSAEPLLAAIDFTAFLKTSAQPGQCIDIDGEWWHRPGSCESCRAALDWVIVGGESGPGARPFGVGWARAVVSQCTTSKVPVFVKQLGSRPFDADALVYFTTYNEWVNKARSWLGGISGGGTKYKEPERAVCVDTQGRVCHIGRDFIRAREEGTFPVTAFQELRLTDLKGGNSAEWPEVFPREFPTSVTA
jgi:protein gp37